MTRQQAIDAIVLERKEQIEKHGHSIDEDRINHERGELLEAAEELYCQKLICFIFVADILKTKKRDQQLIIAGALCLAENEVFGYKPEADDLYQTIVAELTELP